MAGFGGDFWESFQVRGRHWQPGGEIGKRWRQAAKAAATMPGPRNGDAAILPGPSDDGNHTAPVSASPYRERKSGTVGASRPTWQRPCRDRATTLPPSCPVLATMRTAPPQPPLGHRGRKSGTVGASRPRRQQPDWDWATMPPPASPAPVAIHAAGPGATLGGSRVNPGVPETPSRLLDKSRDMPPAASQYLPVNCPAVNQR